MPAPIPAKARADASGATGGDQLVGNKAASRVLTVLSRLGEDAGSYGVTELSRELSMTKNMVYRALNTLGRHGYVVRDRTKTRYQLGPGVLALAGGGLSDLNLPEFTTPYMHSLRDLFGETVTLAVPSGRSAVTVAGVRGHGVLARRIPLGRILPLHISPACRAILASFPDDAIHEYVSRDLEKFGPRTLTTADQVWREIEQVRERGYATVFGDHWQGGNGAAFAIPASASFPHGSITVGGPADRLTDDLLRERLVDAKEIVASLGKMTSLSPSEYTGLDGQG